ncbi:MULTISPECIES: choline-binding transcriptional repressor BetI [unclassified Shimia]|uniref:choline-binding transcriptional repressor BetI n=1 Tax=unclassified Shimia TaxID=2630038 RepID=UPI001ADD2113|nr:MULTISPECIES: transcriptional regulator BetI [unclassified Shimia]MBO9473616.1 transcriptional regulator BetI [Shimia sp. R10_1]MDA5555180.1 transcriptional regulator BetI [Shimia sp. MMG029]
MSRTRIRDIRHEELINATMTAVHKRGYAVVTMAEIAAEAGASAASINYYFGSKEKLMEATMRRLLSLLKDAMLERYATAKTPHDRLMAVIDANFSDRLYTNEQCSMWMQFWANAPYAPALQRLHRINRARVTAHFRAELRALVPDARRETMREALQCYMDGVWLEAAQTETPLDPAQARKEAREVTNLMLRSHA